ncbi:DUF2509 family protein [Pantoea sp.]|uniref:DUF2509 family protein n=1 Tax=Pantoea sp. TaxID=69393 RepID=UPI0028ADBC11|nr:DUF2509 family protein [Pantoea sp.]
MKQAGNSTLGMVLMVLLMGGLTLHATRTRLAQDMVLVADEQQHHQDFWRAAGALQWGKVQHWPQTPGWQCQWWETEQWRSCLLRMEDDHGLLQGSGTGRELALWHWVSLQGNQIRFRAHGWIDYCPLADAALCQAAARIQPGGNAGGDAAAGDEHQRAAALSSGAGAGF